MERDGDRSGPDPGALDDPVAGALAGAQAHLGRLVGKVGRFAVDVSPFATLGGGTDEDWTVLDGLGPGHGVALIGTTAVPAPPGWEVGWSGEGYQMVARDAVGDPQAAAGDLVALGSDDAEAMLDLVQRSRPGPFLRRTVAFGGYVGRWEDGRLVAMAGERLRPPGWAEISGVSTDPTHRRRGLAARMVRVVAAGIETRGERPFLHVSGANVDAVRLYTTLGFTIHRPVVFTVLRPTG